MLNVRRTCWIACFTLTWCAGVVCAIEKAGGGGLRVDMGSWLQRDWAECDSRTKFQYSNNAVRFVSEGSAALLWQIPTRSGRPMALDPDRYPWIGECKRPPREFGSIIRKQGYDTLIDVAENPYLTWRWKVDYSTIGRQRLEKSGKLNKRDDDFNAKLGIAILEKGTNKIREIAYVWSNTLPESLMFKTETTIIPFVWKLSWRRIVVESGRARMKQWVPEVRNLYEDYKRGYPGEEPGKILRVYLMTDTDNTNSRASTWYADIRFHREAPGVP
ncbi:MAG: DUF3047 domain-containing protein [Gemmatimonadota bacterium]|nr:DUF3047 domain-containing protein [Gemmatimonadota bacterium]